MARSIVELVIGDDVEGLYSLLGSGAIPRTALAQAKIALEGRLLRGAKDQALLMRGAIEALELPSDSWEPVMTIPPFMRRSVPEGRVTETRQVLRNLIDSAESRLILAAPFLDQGVRGLLPSMTAFLKRGGSVLLVTRNLRPPESANRRAVELLREVAVHAPGQLSVYSWEGRRLGVHLKALIVDSTSGYVGSANFTWGGLVDHFEMGVHVKGDRVRELEIALKQLANEIEAESRLSSR